MPRLSSTASALIRKLWPRGGSKSRRSLWQRIRPTAWRLRVLRELTNTGDPNAAPYVLNAYLEYGLPAEHIAEMLDVLESRATADSLIGADRARIDTDYGPHWPIVWEKLEPFRRHAGGWAAFAAASLSRNGYIREHAVQALGQAIDDGREIPFLVVRASDHVPQVRQAAVSALRPRVGTARGAALVRTLPLIIHFFGSRRESGHAVIESILTFLVSPEGWPALSAGLDATDVRIRRESFTLAFSIRERRSEVVRRALRSSDPLVRLWGVRDTAWETVPLDDLLAAARYPFTPLRAAVLERLSEVDPAVAQREWKRALLDSSPSIRALARHRTAPLDLRAFYRDALARSEPASIATAIAGLGEVGHAEDAAEVILLTDYPRVRVREAVAGALARLLGKEAIDAVVPMLTDQSPRVARKAAKALARHLTAPLAERVWAIVQDEPPEKAIASLRLLARMPQWQALDYLLRAISRPDPLNSAALDLLRKWYARFRVTGAQPELGNRDAARLRTMLAAIPNKCLPLEMTREIDFSLGFWIREGP